MIRGVFRIPIVDLYSGVFMIINNVFIWSAVFVYYILPSNIGRACHNYALISSDKSSGRDMVPRGSRGKPLEIQFNLGL